MLFYEVMKIRSLFIIFFLVCWSAAISQEESKPKPPRFALGVNFSPAIASRYLCVADNPSENAQSFKEFLTDYNHPVFGYTAGLNFSWFALDRLTLETGVWFAAKGFGVKMTQNSTLKAESTSDNKAKMNFLTGYLTVPLKLNFNIITRPLTVFVSAGISADVLLYSKTKISVVYESGEKKTLTSDGMNSGDRAVSMSYMGSIGIEYLFFKKLKLRFEPTYTMSILPLVYSDLKTYLWTLGGNVGIYYVLR